MVMENCLGNSMNHILHMQTDEENPTQYFKCENDIKNFIRSVLPVSLHAFFVLSAVSHNMLPQSEITPTDVIEKENSYALEH